MSLVCLKLVVGQEGLIVETADGSVLGRTRISQVNTIGNIYLIGAMETAQHGNALTRNWLKKRTYKTNLMSSSLNLKLKRLYVTAMAAALGPLALHSRSARPLRSLRCNLT